MQLRDQQIWKPVKGIQLRDQGVWKPVANLNVRRGEMPPGVGEYWPYAGGWYLGVLNGFGVVIADRGSEVLRSWGPTSAIDTSSDTLGALTTSVLASLLGYDAASYCWNYSAGAAGSLEAPIVITPWFLGAGLFAWPAHALAATVLSQEQRTDPNEFLWIADAVDPSTAGVFRLTSNPELPEVLAVPRSSQHLVRPIRLVLPSVWAQTYSRRAEPFVISGTFASNMDGWTSPSFTRVTTPVLTSPGSVRTLAEISGTASIPDATKNTMSLTLPASMVQGLRVTCKVNHRRNSGTTGAYSVGISVGQSTTTTGGTSASTATWAVFSGYRNIPSDYSSPLRIDVTSYRANATNYTVFDDWEITGTIPT